MTKHKKYIKTGVRRALVLLRTELVMSLYLPCACGEEALGEYHEMLRVVTKEVGKGDLHRLSFRHHRLSTCRKSSGRQVANRQ